MQIAAILTLVISFFEALPRLIKAGVDIYSLAKQWADKLRELRDQHRDPTDEEWAALRASLDADEAALNQDPVAITQPSGTTSPGATSGEG